MRTSSSQDPVGIRRLQGGVRAIHRPDPGPGLTIHALPTRVVLTGGLGFGRAIAVAAIPIVTVPVIAGLNPRADVPITTRGVTTSGQTSIGVAVVRVIARLNSRLHMTIAAGGRRAIVQTSIGLRGVAIVAGFHPSVHDAITATGNHAGVQASIRDLLIAVVAGFDTGLHVTIATRCSAAIV